MLVDFLATKPEGTTIAYTAMNELIGRPVDPTSEGYRYLTSARRILLRDHGIVIDAEPKVGVRVCTNEEKILVSNRDLARGRRAVKRSRQKLTAVQYDQLSDGKKREWNARMSMLGALELMAAPKAVARVEKAIEGHVLPSARTLELFKK